VLGQPAVLGRVGLEDRCGAEVEPRRVLGNVLAAFHAVEHVGRRAEVAAVQDVDHGAVVGTDQVAGLELGGAEPLDGPVAAAREHLAVEPRPGDAAAGDRGEREALLGAATDVEVGVDRRADLEDVLEARRRVERGRRRGGGVHGSSPSRTDRVRANASWPPMTSDWLFTRVGPHVQGSAPVPVCGRNSG
jgi:hypothetical protein